MLVFVSPTVGVEKGVVSNVTDKVSVPLKPDPVMEIPVDVLPKVPVPTVPEVGNTVIEAGITVKLALAKLE